MSRCQILTGHALEALATAIVRGARQWYDTMPPCGWNARLLRAQQRAHACLYWFELEPGRIVVAKMAAGAADLRREYDMLREVQRQFASVPDERLGVVRPVAFLPNFPALVTEFCPHPTLRSLATRLWSRDMAGLEAAFRSSGAWLRAFHSMTSEQRVSRRSGREGFLQSVTACCDRLSAHAPALSLPPDLLPWLGSAAERLLPDTFPLALKHGDYAMRNVLIDPDGKAYALDIGGRWRASPYEDIAYFLTQMDTSRPRMLTGGLAVSREQLTRYQNWFLDGYGRDAVEPDVLVLFRVRALLDRWLALAARQAQQSRPTLVARIEHRHVAGELEYLCQAAGV